MALREYRRKRNFGNTPEPSGGGDGRKALTFVVQLHHASHRHYDFRLEWNGVLKSWAVPKGPSFDPKVKRLAMEVEDHPISYATFEGDIPKGNYGAGHVDVFDHGTWEPEGSARDGLARGDLKFTLHGDILRGSWVLVRTRKQGTKNQWLLIKHADGYSGPRDANDFLDTEKDRPLPVKERKNVWPSESASAKSARTAAKPKAVASKGVRESITGEAFAPELCRTLTTPPAGDDWLHEVKWDGYRMLATVAKGKVRLWSRNAIEWTHKLPELAKAIASLKLKSAQFDGEMIVLRDGRDDFNALQGRLSAANKDPALLILFDMPYLNGYSLRDLPLIDRKAKLEELLSEHDNPLLRFSAHEIGNGASVFKQSVDAKREGIVSKRVNSTYVGTRNGDWVKVKGRPSDEFVVIGFTEPKGSRSGLGALLLARPVKGRLVYAGRVGTGFSDENLRDLRKQLSKTTISETDADISVLPAKDQREAHWVKPKMIIEVFHQGAGGQGLLRQPAFKTIRADKSLDDIGESPRAKKQTSKKAPTKSAPLKVTHAERKVFGAAGITKGEVADYYAKIADRMLPELADRPLSILRCPNGVGAQCFFQKHVKQGMGDHIVPVRIQEENETREYLSVHDTEGLLDLVQMNVLEFHPWGAKSDDVESCDRLVFDLDPHPSVEWKRVVAAARDMKVQLDSIGLQSFLRTSGGKGLHVVVPLNPTSDWDVAKEFCKSVAQAMSALRPKEYVAVAGEKNRVNRIFIDWLRNGRGATSIASYSVRAREGAGVAMPLAWNQLGRIKSGEAFTIENALAWTRNHPDPWKDIARVTQALPDL